jgi:hypothetical protein
MDCKILVICMAVLVAIGCIDAYADTWTAYELPAGLEPSEGCPRSIAFTFENDILSLDNTAVSVGDGGSSTESWTLLLSGNWAVLGTIDSGNLIADPYATFNYQGNGGYITWALNTPVGYNASLLLGASFSGDLAPTYHDYQLYEPTGSSTTGTMALWHSLDRRPQENDYYIGLSHTFTATHVPEPSSILALLIGLNGFIGIIIKRKMHR